MAGRIGAVQAASDGKTYGFVIYDEIPTWHQADNAAREALGLLVTALRCVRR